MVLRVTGTVTLTLALLFGASAANAADHRRTAFQNQSGAEALALAWSAFPAQLSQPAWQPLHLGRSDRIRRQLSDTAALVDHSRLRTAYFCYRYKTNPQTGDHDYCLRKTT